MLRVLFCFTKYIFGEEHVLSDFPSRRGINAILMLPYRLHRWTDIKPTVDMVEFWTYRAANILQTEFYLTLEGHCSRTGNLIQLTIKTLFYNTGSLPIQCQRRWPNSVPAFVRHFSVNDYRRMTSMSMHVLYRIADSSANTIIMSQCCFNVGPASQTVAQH